MQHTVTCSANSLSRRIVKVQMINIGVSVVHIPNRKETPRLKLQKSYIELDYFPKLRSIKLKFLVFHLNLFPLTSIYKTYCY